jgi:succinate-acetate transporter protein
LRQLDGVERLAAGGAVLEARTAAILAPWQGVELRRSALIQGAAGAVGLLAGCALLPSLVAVERHRWVTILAAALLYGGLARLLAALGRLATTAGETYVMERIERLTEEE